MMLAIVTSNYVPWRFS